MDDVSRPTAGRRPCVADRFSDHAPEGGYLKVPFARCADGIARHVTAVAGRSIGPFACLDCGETLSLRRPRNKRAHFSHRPDSVCSGETALHRYAKELLAQKKTLTLPELRLESGGLSEAVFEAGKYDFDEVRPEINLDTFRPDAIVTYRSAKLAVEFLVSHAVDADKKEKVVVQGLSMVEIDLSGLRASRLSSEDLDRAILHSAPRRWIHHRKQAVAAERLEKRVDEKRAQRGRKLKCHIEKKIRATYPPDWRDEATVSVKQERLDHLVDVDVDCSHWFTVPRAIWQAEVLRSHIIEPSRRFSPEGADIAIKGVWPDEHSLSSKIPDWMIRSDLSDYAPIRLEEAGYDRARYGSPHLAVWHYLAWLARRSEVVVWNKAERAFFVAPTLHSRIYRLANCQRIVEGLFGAVQISNPEQAFRGWAHSYRLSGVTVAELIETGGEGYDALSRKLSALQEMVRSYSRKVVDDLCGLPLEPIRERNIAAIMADEEAQRRKESELSSARRETIRWRAMELLEGDAIKWLDQRVETEQVSIIEFAAASDGALAQVECWLAAEVEKRCSEAIKADQVAARRAELVREAQRAFRSPEKADLFLKSGQPKIGGRRPIDYCESETSLKLLLSFLPKR